MPKRQAPSSERASQRAARDENAEINAAVAATEQEITDSVFDDEALSLDGDTSLEEMGDDLEGEDDIRDAEVETDEEVDGEEDDGDEDDDGTGGDVETGEVDDDDDEQQIAAQDRQQGRAPAIPPGRLREASERARAAEERSRAQEIELAEMRGRLDAMSRQPAQVVTPPVVDNFPATPPDAFTDYEGNQAWHVENTRRVAARAAQEAVQSYRQETEGERQSRANEAFQAAATGERSFEFHAAYDNLLKLPKNADSARVAKTIMSAANPAEALFNWWEENGGPEYREAVATQLAEQLGWEVPAREEPAPRRQNGQQRPGQQQRSGQQPQNGARHVVRGPVRPGMRSLNDSGGGLRQQHDPRAIDDSDAAVMDYVME